MKPILSVITITKDDREGVLATVKSTGALRAVTGVRQIVVDSSVSPVSAEIKALLSRENNLEYIWQEPRGIAAAFNAGIEAADSEWVWFLNGRDEVHPDLAADLLLRVLGASRADIIICELEFMQSRARHKHPPLWSLWPPMYPNWVPHPAAFIRYGLFDRYGVFDGEFKIAMDADLWMRLFSKDVVVDMLSIPVVHYDEHGMSATRPVETDREARKIIRKNIGMLVNQWVARGIHLFRSYTKL